MSRRGLGILPIGSVGIVIRVPLSGAGCGDAWVPDRPPLPPRFPPMMDSTSCDRKGRFRIREVARSPPNRDRRGPGRRAVRSRRLEARSGRGSSAPCWISARTATRRGQVVSSDEGRRARRSFPRRRGATCRLECDGWGIPRCWWKAAGRNVLIDPFLTGNPKAAARAERGAGRPDPDLARAWRPRRRRGGDRQAHRRDGRDQLRDQPVAPAARQGLAAPRSRGSSTAGASCSTGRCGSS